MGVTTGSFRLYDSFRENIGNAIFDLDLNGFKVTLHSSAYGASDTVNLSSDSIYTDLSDELTTAIGYTNGGQTLTNVAWVKAGAVVTFSCDDPVWASTGALTAHYFVVRSVETVSGKVEPLVGVGYLDNFPQDVTATSGNNLTISMSVSGLFTLSGGG